MDLVSLTRAFVGLPHIRRQGIQLFLAQPAALCHTLRSMGKCKRNNRFLLIK
jgi:hypothetical protein